MKRDWVAALMMGATLVAASSCAEPQAANIETATPASQPSAAAAPAASTKAAIAWDAAKDHVGQTVTVIGPVVGTHVTSAGDHLVLNVGKDYPDPERFSVYMPTEGGDVSPDAKYKGKTIQVTGEVTLYDEVPEIRAEAKDVVIEN